MVEWHSCHLCTWLTSLAMSGLQSGQISIKHEYTWVLHTVEGVRLTCFKSDIVVLMACKSFEQALWTWSINGLRMGRECIFHCNIELHLCFHQIENLLPKWRVECKGSCLGQLLSLGVNGPPACVATGLVLCWSNSLSSCWKYSVLFHFVS